MIISILTSGFRLSNTRDKQLLHGIYWTIAEGFFAAISYVFLYQLLKDAFSKNLTTSAALHYGLGMAISFVARIMVSCIGAPKIYNGAFSMMGKARLRAADHLRKLPMGWFNQQRGGDLAGRLTNDFAFVEHMWSHFIQPFVLDISMPIFLTAFLFFIDWRLACVMVCGFPLTIIALLGTLQMGKKAGIKLSKANSAVQSTLLEYVQSIAVIRSFGRFGIIWKKLVEVLDNQRSAWMNTEAKTAPFLSFFGFVLELSYISLVLFGMYWVTNATISASTLLIFLVISLPVYRQLFDVGKATVLLHLANRAINRIDLLLAEKTLPEPEQPQQPARYDIVFDKVSFCYNTKCDAQPVLNQISCKIAPNKLTAIVGHSGAGKTTFVHLIARLWDVTEGAILLGGIDLRKIGTDNLHRLIGMVFQDVLLFSGSVIDNIKIGNENATREEIIDAAKQAEAHEFIMALPQGYDTILDENGSSLSGGERQRISIARAFLKNAPILLLDEATASLDPSSEIDVQRAMNALTATRTVVVIAHSLNSIRQADNIIVLDNGRIVEQGKHDELISKNGLYRNLWNRQNANQQLT